MNRRDFLNGIIGLSGIGIAIGIYAWQVEPFWLEFVHVKMPIKNLPLKLAGKTMMQISDIHVGNRFDYKFIINAFIQAQKLKPDFVVYTGDYISYENEKQFDQLKEVLKYAVKGKLGTIGILGNHDYGRNWSQDEVAEQVTKLMTDAGIPILRNEQAEMHGLNFIGVDDYWAKKMDPALALSNYDENKANVLLCHNPDACDINVWDNYKGWILAGHTHGGQCKPPFLNPPILPVRNEKYSAGKIDLEDGRILYVNRALGHLWQVRFNVRPEITIFELE
ncbi:MAG: metallophosphoesterase [Candidatus Kapabacteria bacterium]|jgi:predicted MPP superfamily phosphohydrolase|nr:metallophosphoesterase [Candidatus Kapabacteria bacterium]